MGWPEVLIFPKTQPTQNRYLTSRKIAAFWISDYCRCGATKLDLYRKKLPYSWNEWLMNDVIWYEPKISWLNLNVNLRPWKFTNHNKIKNYAALIITNPWRISIIRLVQKRITNLSKLCVDYHAAVATQPIQIPCVTVSMYLHYGWAIAIGDDESREKGPWKSASDNMSTFSFHFEVFLITNQRLDH